MVADQRSFIKAPKPNWPEVLADFGYDLAISDDGETLAISAPFDSSSATGVSGTPGSGYILQSGAVYLY